MNGLIMTVGLPGRGSTLWVWLYLWDQAVKCQSGWHVDIAIDETWVHLTKKELQLSSLHQSLHIEHLRNHCVVTNSCYEKLISPFFPVQLVQYPACSLSCLQKRSSPHPLEEITFLINSGQPTSINKSWKVLQSICEQIINLAMSSASASYSSLVDEQRQPSRC